MNKDIKQAKELAKQARITTLEITYRAKASHIASNFSCTDILSTLYECYLAINPSDPNNKENDIFILSKGHAAVGLYAILAEKKFFPKEELINYGKNGTELAGHISHHVPGVIFSTGSLGHGLGLTCGVALGKNKTTSTSKTICLLSDGELNEGSVWEAFLFAAHHKLKNLTCIIDKNNLQGLGATQDIINTGDLKKKLEAFNFTVYEVDGHNHEQIITALSAQSDNNKPKVIIANTIKGKGVSFMENNNVWHYRSPTTEEYNLAREELLNNA